VAPLRQDDDAEVQVVGRRGPVDERPESLSGQLQAEVHDWGALAEPRDSRLGAFSDLVGAPPQTTGVRRGKEADPEHWRLRMWRRRVAVPQNSRHLKVCDAEINRARDSPRKRAYVRPQLRGGLRRSFPPPHGPYEAY
jgi:hypothetical protein